MQDGEGPEIQKKVTYCLRIMSRLFADPAKAEENFQILDQLKDVNIWKILSSLIDPKTSFHQACSSRVRIKMLAQMLLSLTKLCVCVCVFFSHETVFLDGFFLLAG